MKNSVAGDVNPADVQRQMTRWFGGIARGPAVTRRTAPAFTLAADVYATLEDRVQLPRVFNAWHTVKAFAPDDAALSVLGMFVQEGLNAMPFTSSYKAWMANRGRWEQSCAALPTG